MIKVGSRVNYHPIPSQPATIKGAEVYAIDTRVKGGEVVLVGWPDRAFPLDNLRRNIAGCNV